MKQYLWSIVFVIFAIVCISATALAQTTAFKYQGSLNDGANPANGSFEMRFKLFDSLGGAGQIGSTTPDIPVTVTNGVFSVSLDFGSNALSGANRWLEIAVRRNSGESYTTLSPREQIASSPYSVRTLSAATADTATNALNLGGVAANEYVTTSSVGNSFIKNDTTSQTANFNISGNGRVGGAVGIGIDPLAGYKLDVNGPLLVRSPGTGGNMQLSNPGGETGLTISGVNRADVRFDGSALRLFAGTGTAIPQTGLLINTGGNGGISGNFGVGTFNPDTRLTLQGGPQWTLQGWTASMNLRNTAAIGWDANSSGQRWGIGQQTGGLHFFRTFSSFGSGASSAVYSMTITDTGNIIQEPDKGGLVKAMVAMNADGTIARCYNSVANTSSGNCAFTVVHTNIAGVYDIDFLFQVSNRFIAITPQRGGGGGFGVPVGASYDIIGPTTVRVAVYVTDERSLGAAVTVNNPFMIIVY